MLHNKKKDLPLDRISTQIVSSRLFSNSAVGTLNIEILGHTNIPFLVWSSNAWPTNSRAILSCSLLSVELLGYFSLRLSCLKMADDVVRCNRVQSWQSCISQ